MFQGLKRQLVKAETVKATLTFQRAGDLPVDFAVGGPGATGPAGMKLPAVDLMKGTKMD